MNRKIILIANNIRLNNKLISQANIKKNDLLVLFNHCHPFMFNIIKEHNNNIVFIRKINPTPNFDTFSGLDFVSKNINKFNFIYPCNGGLHGEDLHMKILKELKLLNKINQEFIEKINFQHIEVVKNYFSNFKYQGSPTTGFIAYCYFKEVKDISDKIILLGFDLIYNNKLLSGFHNGKYELDYYINEEGKGNLLRIN